MSSQVHHPIFARCYGWLSERLEDAGVEKDRRRLLDGLAGEVVEVGAGNGLNFAYYPAGVTRVLAVEPEPSLRRRAEQRARVAPVPVEVVDDVADSLPVGDGSVDAVVFSLVLCSVPDQGRALAEARRVLRGDGELRFYEHVVAETPVLRRVQRAVDATFWPLCAGGCRTGRDTLHAIEGAGFDVHRVRHLRIPKDGPPHPAAPHILGAASKGA